MPDDPATRPLVPPGDTPLRMLARAVADALTLPPPKAEHDEELRYAVLGQRAIVVEVTCRRLADDVEADLHDAVTAAASIRERCADYPVNYSVSPYAS